MVLYSLAIPNVAAICKSVSKQLTEYENYETSGSHEYHLMQKVFIFNALTSYMSILLTAYIYIPFGPQVIATAQSYGLPFAKATIDTDMLQTRLRAFMITTQAVSFATETVVPWLTRRAMVGAVKVQKKVSHKLSHEISSDEEDHAKTECVYGDSAEAQKFLMRVKKQVDLPEYDVNEDYAEMVLQVKTFFSVCATMRKSYRGEIAGPEKKIINLCFLPLLLSLDTCPCSVLFGP